jgi:hypothetical protein
MESALRILKRCEGAVFRYRAADLCIAQAHYIVDLYLQLMTQYTDSLAVNSVGVIVFYRAQRRLLAKLFKERVGANCGVEISTVDGFQGREKDIIIVSCVRAPAEAAGTDSNRASPQQMVGKGVGFLKDWQVNIRPPLLNR